MLFVLYNLAFQKCSKAQKVSSTLHLIAHLVFILQWEDFRNTLGGVEMQLNSENVIYRVHVNIVASRPIMMKLQEGTGA